MANSLIKKAFHKIDEDGILHFRKKLRRRTGHRDCPQPSSGIRRECLTDEGFRTQTMCYPVAKILECQKNKPEFNLMDVGCSNGRIITYLQVAHLFPTYIAVDVRTDPLIEARLRWPKAIACLMDARTLSQGFRERSVDFIVFTEVIEHMPRAHGVKVLSEFFKVLRRGGHVVITTPNAAFGPNMEKEKRTFGHEYLWKKNDLVSQLEKSGFEVLEALDGKYMSSGVNFRSLTQPLISELGEESALKLLKYFRQHFGTTFTTYVLGGFCGQRAGETKILARKP